MEDFHRLLQLPSHRCDHRREDLHDARRTGERIPPTHSAWRLVAPADALCRAPTSRAWSRFDGLCGPPTFPILVRFAPPPWPRGGACALVNGFLVILLTPLLGLLCDLLWSDPDKDITGWSENDRGVSFTFGPDVVSRFLQKHDMDLICRAHQVSLTTTVALLPTELGADVPLRWWRMATSSLQSGSW